MEQDEPVAQLLVAALQGRLSRRTVLQRAVTLGLGTSSIAALLAACGRDDNGDDGGSRGMVGGDEARQPGMMDGGMPDWMMSPRAMDPQMMQAMPVIRDLLLQHERIQRQVEALPDGIRAITISQDPAIAALIRVHVWQMQGRVARGHPIRQMDPLFREIFRHHQQIEMDIEHVPGGVRVTERSDDAQVQLLIRQHAHRAVSAFVASGMPRAMQPTPLPGGYRGG